MSTRAQAARGYRMRPAPRRRSSSRARSRPGRVNWDRVGRVALVLVLFAVLASYVGPSLNFIDAWRDLKAEQANVATLHEENEDLRRKISILAEPDAAERAARKNGMVGAGERPYVIKGLDR